MTTRGTTTAIVRTRSGTPHPRYHYRYHYSGEVARCARVVPRSCPHTPDTVLALVYR